MTNSVHSVSNIDKMGCFGGSDSKLAELKQKVDELQSILNDKEREVCFCDSLL